MPLRNMCVSLLVTGLALHAAGVNPVSAGPVAEEAEGLPRGLTPVEAALIEQNPIIAEGLGSFLSRGAASEPVGRVVCPPEYAPMEGILMAYEGQSGWKQILHQMAARITNEGAANVYVLCDTTGEAASARNAMIAAGADGARVFTFVQPTNSIWMRDYGPRYIMEGNGGPGADRGVRSIVDHTYNRPRPNDNLLPDFWAGVRGETQYQIPLVHGGGNYHLSGLSDSYATRLIANENGFLSESDIVGLWRRYQNLETELTAPLPANVDATQHIDMWMQITGDRSVVIADYPLASGSTHDQIADAQAAAMQADGYAVTRVDNIGNPGATHYTFTNVVMCNDIVLLPEYDSIPASFSANALAAWRAHLPDKQIIQVDCDAIVGAAGVMHCIVMHVPASADGVNPVVWIDSLNNSGFFEPGETFTLTWRTDDDGAFFGAGVESVDLQLSTDGGQNFEPQLTDEADDGSLVWTVPNIATSQGVLRIVARDPDGNTGYDDTDELFIISGSPACNIADLAEPFAVLDLDDVQAFIAGFTSQDPIADLASPSGVFDLADVQAFIGAFAAGCP